MKRISWKIITGIILTCLRLNGQGETEGKIPMLEELFAYEHVVNYADEENYYVITGINGEYKENFTVYMEKIAEEAREGSFWTLLPADVYGVPIKGIGEGAFLDVPIKGLILPDGIEVIGAGAFKNTKVTKLKLPESVREIGEEAFADCGLEDVRFPDNSLTVRKKAFEGNRELWKVLVPEADSVIEEEAFAGCDKDLLLCCDENAQRKGNLVRKYAEENGYDYMEMNLSDKPIVNYPAEPIILKPEVKGFFYGDDADPDMDGFWDFQMQENAPNFGFVDWHLPGCSTWCGCMGFEQEAEATSELSSNSGRYSAENILIQNRDSVWAEGAEGAGMGESITYRQSCKYSVTDKFDAMMKGNLNPVIDGFMRYSEICIVNGYAKSQKTWEENGRVKTLLMLVEGRPYAYLQLEDTMMPQYYTLPEDDIKVLSGEMIEFEFVIEEVYPGSAYEDTCLTGIVMEFTGRFAH